MVMTPGAHLMTVVMPRRSGGRRGDGGGGDEGRDDEFQRSSPNAGAAVTAELDFRSDPRFDLSVELRQVVAACWLARLIWR
jgi:hypothetical protein